MVDHAHIIRPGLNHVGAYQASGRPWITGSTLLSSSFGTNNAEYEINFPYVTKNVTIISRATGNLRIHFDTVSGSNVVAGNHFITLSDSKDSISMDIKCNKIYISLEDASADGAFECVAQLTTIAAEEMYILSGSGINT